MGLLTVSRGTGDGSVGDKVYFGGDGITRLRFRQRFIGKQCMVQRGMEVGLGGRGDMDRDGGGGEWFGGDWRGPAPGKQRRQRI